MKIVVLDGHTANPGDLSWHPIERLGSLTVYPRTAPEEVVQRVGDAEVIITNKVKITDDLFAALPNLDLVCVAATGYDHIDLAAAEKHGVVVTNVANYSTHSVAQHVFALLLNSTNQVAGHHAAIQAGDWNTDFSFTLGSLPEIHSKTLGIAGFGTIGKQVAQIALAFGMKVIAFHRHPKRDATAGVTFVDRDELLTGSDFLSLHLPLNDETKHWLDATAFAKMKPTAVVINTGRGGLIHETDLVDALTIGQIAHAALDVTNQEPLPQGHPFLTAPNLVLTPHIAWNTLEARERLIETIGQNIRSFLQGEPENRVGG